MTNPPTDRGHLTGNRAERRRQIAEQHKYADSLPEDLTLARSDPEAIKDASGARPFAIYRSRYYLVQMFAEADPNIIRLSICRSKIGQDGRWLDGLSWDELQSIKSAVGYGDFQAFEVYPADSKVIDVANMRHLWVMQQPIPLGWGYV